MIITKLITIYRLFRQGKKKQAIRELRESVVKFRHRADRGEQVTHIFTSPIEQMIMKGGMIILVLEKIADKLDVIIPIWFWPVFIPILYITQKVVEYQVGRADQKYLKLWECEQDWVAKNISKWEQKKMKLLKLLVKRL